MKLYGSDQRMKVTRYANPKTGTHNRNPRQLLGSDDSGGRHFINGKS